MNFMPFWQLKSFLKILIGVQYQMGSSPDWDIRRGTPLRGVPLLESKDLF